MIKLSVVILNWNGRKFLEEFLPDVVRYSADGGVEVVVADNGSDDDSLAFLAQAFPAIRVIRLDRNYGFTGGYNRALAQIEAEYYLLLNSDVKVTEGWLTPIIRMMDTEPEVAAVMPKVLSYANPEYFEYAGASGGFIDYVGYPFCRGRMFGVVEKDEGQHDTPREVFWATGAAMAVRASVWREAGGFDEDFFAHMEEIDLCWRMKLLGYRIMVEPASTVYHIGGGTLSTSSPKKAYYNFRNNLAMLYKNLPAHKLWLVIIARMLFDGAAAMWFISKGMTPFFSAVWTAHRDFYRWLPELRRKRAAIGKKHNVSMIYRGVAGLRYSLGHKKFDNII